MQEFVTDAVVLNSNKYLNGDRGVDLFTRDNGRIQARVKSGFKTISKLSPHLDVMNLVTVRLVKKTNFKVTDALLKDRFAGKRNDLEQFSEALDLIFLIRLLVPPMLPDKELWRFFITGLRESIFNRKMFLRALGYDPEFASCHFCERDVKFFFAPDQFFICQRCFDGAKNKNSFMNIFPSSHVPKTKNDEN